MTPLHRRLLLSAVLLLALAARIANLHGVFVQGDVILFFTDSYYHLRRAWLTALHFPHVPSFDYFVNYPEGALLYWGPALDWLNALIAWICAGRAPDLRTVAQVSAWTPVVLGVLNVALVYLCGFEAFGPRAGLVAAALFALSPLTIWISAIGDADHHVAEALFLSAPLWLLLRALRGNRRWAPAALSGAALSVGLLFWPGATLASALLSGSAMAAIASRLWLADPSKTREDLSGALRVALGSACLTYAPVAALGARVGFGPFAYYAVTWFQEAVLISLLAVGLVLHVLDHRRPSAGRPRVGSIALTAGIVIGAAGLLLILLPDFRVMLVRGVSEYLYRRDPMLHAVIESNPITYWPFRVVLQEGTGLLLFSPVLIALSLWVFRRGRGSDVRLGVVAWLGLATLPLIAMQFSRYGAYHVLPLSLLAGWALAGKAAPLRVGWRMALGGLLVIVMLPTCFQVLKPSRRVNGDREFGPVSEALEWVRYNTPPTRGLENPREKPEYAILALWDYGHWINVIGERANIANPFGVVPRHIRGAVRSTAVLLEADGERAADMCQRWGARYVLSSMIMPYFQNLALLVGRKPETYGFYPDHVRPTPRFFRSLNTRLLFSDGGPAKDGGGKAIPAVGRFRLVYESPDRFDWDTSAWGALPPGFTERSVAAVKIYERVKGAVLSGRTRPFFPVRAEVAVRTNIGRRFLWQVSGMSGADGRFRLWVPYATEKSWLVGRTSSPDAYRVTCGGPPIAVPVSEEAVFDGREVSVPCGAASPPARRAAIATRDG